MPRDSLGVYTPPASTWNPAIPSTPISTTDWNSLLTDMANGLTTSIASDGSTPTTANIPFAFGITGNVTGNITGNGSGGTWTGPVVGNVAGNLTGNSTGTHTGAVVGTTVSASGGFTGNLTGNASTASTASTAITATTATNVSGGTGLLKTPAVSSPGLIITADPTNAQVYLSLRNNAASSIWHDFYAIGPNATNPMLLNGLPIVRVGSGTGANAGLITWGTGAPGTLQEGQIYLQVDP